MRTLSFSYPTGFAGAGLLLLRTSLAAELLTPLISSVFPSLPIWQIVGVSLIALALCLGVWTPGCCAVVTISQFASVSINGPATNVIHITNGVVSLALALLGPGAYSLDAKWFGRRVVILPESKL